MSTETPRGSGSVPPTPAHIPNNAVVVFPFGKESAAMLTVYSVFLLVEGCWRFLFSKNYHDIYGTWAGNDSDVNPNFPAVVLLIGAAFELLFAAYGLWLGVGHLLFEWGNATATGILLLLQLLLGAYTFIVWTIAFPAFLEDQVYSNATQFYFFSEDQMHAARVFGEIFTIMCWSGIMWAAQIYFALALYRYQLNTHKGNDTPSYRMRLGVFAAIIFWSGLSILILGGLFRDNLGAGQYGDQWIYFPNVIAYSAITIVTGILLIIYGLLGWINCTDARFTPTFLGISIIIWLWLLCAHNLVQLSYSANGIWDKTGMTTYMIVLMTSLVLAPMYFSSRFSGHYSPVSQTI